MSRRGQRIDRIRLELTPTQIMVAWMEGIHPLGSFEAWGDGVRACSDDDHPLNVLTDHVQMSVRAATKDQNWKAAHAIELQAVRDVVFLYHLHLGVNTAVREALDRHRLVVLTLLAEFQLLLDQESVSRAAVDAWRYISDRTPFPATDATVAALEAARMHYVESWPSFEGNGVIAGWVVDHHVAEGRSRLPFGAYALREGDAANPVFAIPTEAELRALFGNDEAYERFMAGEEFSHGVVGVTDEEIEAQCASVEQAFRQLVDDGVVDTGRSVLLESVAVEGLGEAPLVDREWIDAHVVELAEAGAILESRGVEYRPPNDNHPLAQDRLFSPGGAALPEDQEQAARDTARANLARFTGGTHEIDGRVYFRFEDYVRWRGRKMKAKPVPAEGFAVASWNHWVEMQRASAMLAGVRVAVMTSYPPAAEVARCPDDHEAARRRRQRQEALAALRQWTLTDFEQPGGGFWSRRLPVGGRTYAEEAEDMRGNVEALLTVLCELRHAVALIQGRYFNDRPALFPATVADLDEAIKHLDQMANRYNEMFAEERERYERIFRTDPAEVSKHRIDQERVRTTAVEGARDIGRRIVVHAQAEALASVGKTEEARALMGRLIRTEGPRRDGDA